MAAAPDVTHYTADTYGMFVLAWRRHWLAVADECERTVGSMRWRLSSIVRLRTDARHREALTMLQQPTPRLPELRR